MGRTYCMYIENVLLRNRLLVFHIFSQESRTGSSLGLNLEQFKKAFTQVLGTDVNDQQVHFQDRICVIFGVVTMSRSQIVYTVTKKYANFLDNLMPSYSIMMQESITSKCVLFTMYFVKIVYYIIQHYIASVVLCSLLHCL